MGVLINYECQKACLAFCKDDKFLFTELVKRLEIYFFDISFNIKAKTNVFKYSDDVFLGLYRDDGLILLRNFNGQQTGKVRKEKRGTVDTEQTTKSE